MRNFDTDEDDMDILRERAEFADETCLACGNPLAVDGLCESEDCEPEFMEDDDFLIDVEEGGEA